MTESALIIGKDLPCGFCPCCIAPVVDKLRLERVKEARGEAARGHRLERVKEALHRSIVIAVALLLGPIRKIAMG
jgi:hypothetical protein